MGKSIVLLVAALGLLSGCAGEVWYVDSRFTNDEEAQIQAAADSWEAVGAARVDMVFGAKVNEFEESRNVITRTGLRAATQAWDGFLNAEHCAVTMKRPTNERIIIVPEIIDPGAFQAVAAHEFGHHYGLHHSSIPRALMFEEPGAEAPTELDVQALRLVGQL